MIYVLNEIFDRHAPQYPSPISFSGTVYNGNGNPSEAGMNNMDDYHARVYEIVARIPKGKVATYVQIAALLGNPQAARRVGHAMYHAPTSLDLPCHRVVNAKGEMLVNGTFGGPDNQRSRLRKEGVFFKPNGCVDFRMSLWKFETE